MKLTGVFFEKKRGSRMPNYGTWYAIFMSDNFVRHIPLPGATDKQHAQRLAEALAEANLTADLS